MNIKDFFLAINVELDIEYQMTSRSEGFYSVKGRGCEIKDGICLVGEYGSGSTRKQALDSYAASISGMRLVVNAMSPDRREYTVPSLLPKPRVTKKKVTKKKAKKN